MFPLGTLDMTWDPLNAEAPGRTSRYPQRHLPFANLVERTMRKAAREASHLRPDPPQPDSLQTGGIAGEALDVAQSYADREGFEDHLLAVSIAGASSEGLVARSLAPARRSLISTRQHLVRSEGEMVPCVDIRDAAELLGRGVKILQRHDEAGKIAFIRGDDDHRHLPLADIDRARIAVRKPGEWRKLLGVSTETVRQWMADIPEGTSPERLEELLLGRKAGKGKLNR